MEPPVVVSDPYVLPARSGEPVIDFRNRNDTECGSSAQEIVVCGNVDKPRNQSLRSVGPSIEQPRSSAPLTFRIGRVDGVVEGENTSIGGTVSNRAMVRFRIKF